MQFDTDALLDYRARRPTMYFDQDHLTDYKPAKLSLYLAKDELGQPFLLLTGFEPDFQWERFTQAVLQLVERYGVEGHHLGARHPDADAAHPPDRRDRQRQPHRADRRDVDLAAAHAGADERAAPARVPPRRVRSPDGRVRAAHPALPRRHRVPARRGQRAREHQRRDRADLPDRPRCAKRTASSCRRSKTRSQKNSELQRLVGTLEERHDSYMEENALPSPLIDEDGEVPRGDAIAAELERFLAQRNDD